MYTKIHKPKTQGKSVYSNKGSAGRVVNYLRSEELKENPNAHITYQTDKGDMNYGEAIENIDSQSKGIAEGKVKFTSLSFNLSQEEAQALKDGKKGDERSKKERVGDFTKKLMDEYGLAFPKKDINEEDLVYVAKVHEHRKQDGKLNKENQTHIHVVVSNLTKEGQYINPETKHRSHFNKSKFFNNVEKLTSRELGTEIRRPKTLDTNFSKTQTKDRDSIVNSLKGIYYNSQGKVKLKEQVSEILAENIKGLGKEANKITIVEMTPKQGNYFKNPENAKKSADKIMDNYAKSLKADGVKKEDIIYYYQVSEKAKNPSLKIVISNRNKGMKKSVGANSKSFNFKEFEELNNKFYGEIVKSKNHISPTEKNVFTLNKKFDAGIDYKESFNNKWLGKDSEEYKQTKEMLNQHFKGYKGIKKQPIKQETERVISMGQSVLMKMLADKTQKEDLEIIRVIKERTRKEQGLRRERRM